MNISIRQFIVAAWTAGFILCLAPALLHAFVKNEGDDAISVEILKDEGLSSRQNIYPEQSIPLPSNARAVRVFLITSDRRGDENISVKIVEKDGKTGYLRELGKIYELNSEETQEAKKSLRRGSISNKGNIPVDLVVRRAGKLSMTYTLYVGQPLTLPEDTVEVETVSRGPQRGDEIVNISVLMPDGKVTTIGRFGGIASLEEE